MSTDENHLNEVRARVTDLWNLEFQGEANESNPAWDERNEFVYAYDIAFPLAKLISLGFIEFHTLPEKSLKEISQTWSVALENGFFNSFPEDED
jgi:hypothetical protein